MKLPQLLTSLGLSKNEAKVYLALLDLGSATAGKIAEKSKVHRTNVYDALERLIEKGVVTYIFKKDIKNYCFHQFDVAFFILIIDMGHHMLMYHIMTDIIEIASFIFRYHVS